MYDFKYNLAVHQLNKFLTVTFILNKINALILFYTWTHLNLPEEKIQAISFC